MQDSICQFNCLELNPNAWGTFIFLSNKYRPSTKEFRRLHTWRRPLGRCRNVTYLAFFER